LTNERWLKWTIARYYRSHDFRLVAKPVRVGNAMVATGNEQTRKALEKEVSEVMQVESIRGIVEKEAPRILGGRTDMRQFAW